MKLNINIIIKFNYFSVYLGIVSGKKLLENNEHMI